MTVTLDLDRIVAVAEHIPGWMHRSELRYLAEQASQYHHCLEVGSFMGRSTKALAMATPGTVYAVDDWRGEADQPLDRDELQRRFTEHLMPELVKGKVVHINMASLDAAKRYQAKGLRWQLIFLDGSHDYESVVADITHWLPLLAPGGVLLGHDYHMPAVKLALSDVLPNATLATYSIWEWRAP